MKGQLGESFELKETAKGVNYRRCAKLFPPEMALKHHHSIQVSSGTSLKFPGFSYVTTSSSEIT